MLSLRQYALVILFFSCFSGGCATTSQEKYGGVSVNRAEEKIQVTSPSDLPPSVGELLTSKNIKVAWVTNSPQAESLRLLKTIPDAYDIVVLEEGNPSSDVSLMLRDWLEGGGIIWAFDRAFGSTWRNRALFGGLIPGADQDWEPPEKTMAMIEGLSVLPYDNQHPVADGVGTINLAGDHTTARKAGTNEVYSGLTTFERALDTTTIPLLKAHKVGEAVIPLQFHSLGWVVVGFVKKAEKGQVAVLPSLDYTNSGGARFLANLAEWCISHKAR